MKIAVVLNGAVPSAHLLRRVAEEAEVYAADGGAKACLAASVQPVMVVGDLDSQDKKALPGDWVCVKDEDQNFTDFEKVLRRVPEEMTSLVILGGLGGRLDHAWNNLVIAAGVSHILPVCFFGDHEMVWRVTPGCPLSLELERGALVSLLPMGDVSGVTTEGLRWELQDAHLGPGKGLAQSNQTEGPTRISVTSGSLYLWTESHPI